MMRNIIAITVLFSLIVTFANFDIVQIMTAGGPRNMTHVFATYAFLLGIRSGDLPLGAASSLFMFPILAIAAVFILRGCAGGRRKLDEQARHRSADNKAYRCRRQPAPQPPLGVDRVLRISNHVRGLLPVATLLHGGDGAQERRRDGPARDQSVDHCRRHNARPVPHPAEKHRLPDLFQNTAIVTVCVVAITMVVSVLAAFSLARMKFWGSGVLATGIFLTYLVPDTLLFLPLFQIVKALGLLNNYWAWCWSIRR